MQALELIERQFGTLPSIFTTESGDLANSQNEEIDDWSDKDDVMTEVKK